MTDAHIELLASIQALTLAGPKQTGHRYIHEVRADTHARGGYVVSEVIVYRPSVGRMEPELRILTQIEQDGTDSPTGLDEGERTLAGQRDELSTFIAEHRKQESAA